MTIRACRECGGLVSDSAQACPHCGAGKGGAWSWLNKTLGNVVTILIIIALIALFFIK